MVGKKIFEIQKDTAPGLFARQSVLQLLDTL
jgi:hypothetical protein